MVSCRETPVWNNGCKSDVLLVSKDLFLSYDGKPMVFAEKLQFETTDVKAMNVWSLNTYFYLTIWKPMVSWWETPILNTGCKSDELLVSKDSFLPYDENRWFLDEKLQFETQDVKAMNFWSLNTRFYLRLKTDGFLMRKSNLKQQAM